MRDAARELTSRPALVHKAEWVAAVNADVFRETAPPREKTDAMRAEKANQWMAYEMRARFRFQEAVAAVARVLGESVARRHRADAVSEQTARVAHLLAEPLAAGEGIRGLWIDERMAAAYADVLTHSVPVCETHVGVMPQEARQRMTDVRRGTIFRQVLRAAAAVARFPTRAPEHPVVDDVAPDAAAQAED